MLSSGYNARLEQHSVIAAGKVFCVGFCAAVVLGCSGSPPPSSESPRVLCPQGTYLQENRCTSTVASASASGSAVPPTSPVSEQMVWIPEGTFLMGTDTGFVKDRYEHQVHVKSFQIDRTEVTVAAFRACVVARKCAQPGNDPGCSSALPGKDNHPVDCVDLEQAKAYCAWVGKRLPTEEEWEYAARGPESRLYPWGNTFESDRLCWNRGPDEGTCEVGSFPAGASPFGVQDLEGNVGEWTSSFFSDGYASPRSPDKPLLRGSRWHDTHAEFIQPWSRSWVKPTIRSVDIGFRCARDSTG